MESTNDDMLIASVTDAIAKNSRLTQSVDSTQDSLPHIAFSGAQRKFDKIAAMSLRRLLPFSLICVAYIVTGSPSTHHVTKADVDRWMSELSNWGRWGKDDQIGAVRLIDDAKRREAATLVKEGFSVSLAHDTETQRAADNPSPFSHKMLSTGARPSGQFVLDEYSVAYHGYAHTHMDALCHMAWKGKMFNGFPQTDVTKQGAKELAITGYKNGIFTRGVLIDVPYLRNVPYLEPGTPIYPEDLDEWEKKTDIKVGRGDVVFIRTGRWARREAKGPWDPARVAGLYASCAKWLKDRDVAMVGSDAATDVMPSRVPGVVQPMHQLLLVAMGTPIFDNCDLEALSKAAAARHRWTFLLSASPLSVPGGTGSPLNPIATF
jgi:kynurenine formamidase